VGLAQAVPKVVLVAVVVVVESCKQLSIYRRVKQ
jgi:hypothetical protein